MNMTFRDRLSPGFVIVVVLALGIVLLGYNITTTQQHSADMKELIMSGRQAATERFNIQQAEDRKDNEEMAMVRQVLQQQGNLSEESRQKIITNMETILPEISQNMEQIMKDHKLILQILNDTGIDIPINNTDKEITPG